MYIVSPSVPYIPQITQYDCWHASLRMICKWRYTDQSEPVGTHTAWLYTKCREAQSRFNTLTAQHLSTIKDPDEINKHHANVYAKKNVTKWSIEQALLANSKKFKPFSEGRPGLTRSLLPTILAENKLRAVLGPACISPEMAATSAAVEEMLSSHGPLYCLVNFGHVVVIVGVDGDKLHVCDPLFGKGPTPVGFDFVTKSPCVARIG